MGLLERWDRHNQRVMDRARTEDPPAWTIPTVLLLGVLTLRLADRFVDSPWVGLAVSVVVITTIVAIVVRIVRNRRRAARDDELAAAAADGRRR